MLHGAETKPVGSKIDSLIPHFRLLLSTMPPHYCRMPVADWRFETIGNRKSQIYGHYYITLKHYYSIIGPKKASEFRSTAAAYAKLNPRTTPDNVNLQISLDCKGGGFV
jgi:hypothetical protein